MLILLLAACSPRREPPGAEITLPTSSRNVRFVAVGDTGEGNAGQMRVAAGMKAACEAKGCDFALLLGDNLYPKGPTSPTDPELRRKIADPYAPLGVPVLAALGNHDDGGSGWSPERGDHEIAWAEAPSWWKTPARHYRASIGDVDLIVLDTDAILYGRGGDQTSNVARWLKTTKARFTIVAGHHPMKSNGPHGDAGAYDRLPSLIPVASGRSLKRFLEREVCGKANVYLSAHDHVRAWMKDGCAGTELIVAGTGSKPKPVVERHPAWFQSGELGFFHGEMGTEGFRGEMMSADGKTDFTRLVPR
jgi:hypothetical protein